MKNIKLIPVVLILMLLLATACSKNTMQNASTDQDAQPPTQTEPMATTPAPEPEPQAINNDASGNAAILDQLVYFDFDSAVLKPEAQSVLQLKAQWLNEHPETVAMIIEGHCDERGTDAYNMALGAKRAEAVKNYLVTLGITVDKLDTQSYGEEKPADMGHNETAWSKNRRASFVLN